MTINIAIAKTQDDITWSRAIPLCDLVAWDGNVRKITADATIGELAASIAAHGLLQSPVVREREDGTYEVVAGKRRLLALNLLVEQGKITAAAKIDCHVLTADDDADEISLAENIVREAMHPADQCDAFKALVKKGDNIIAIAARFGVSETVVKKRLLLANLAPAILAAFRDDKLSLAMVQAFAVTEDHDRQVNVFNDMDDDDDWTTEDIRAALTEGRIPATDKRVKFVTRGAYEQAGGAISRDLFCTDESGFFIEDPELLDRLVLQGLEAAAETLRAQGWSWVDVTVDGGWSYASKHKLREIHPDYEDQTPEAAAETAALEAEAEKIEHDAADRDLTGAETGRLDEINDRLSILEKTPEIWTEDDKATGGIVLSLGHEGDIRVNAYRRPEAAAAKKKVKSAAGADDADTSGADDAAAPPDTANPHELPKPLIRALTGHRTAALAASLTDKPDLALAVLVHKLGADLLYDDHAVMVSSCLDITAGDVLNDRLAAEVNPDTSPAFAAMTVERDAWSGQLPEDPDAFWGWCLKQKRQKLLNLLAYLVARSIDATCFNMKRLEEADALADALALDMATYWTPTTENYFKHVGKITILANLNDALGLSETPAAWAKLPHDKLAALAEREIAGTGWLPDILCAPPLPGSPPETPADGVADADAFPDDEFADDEDAEEDSI